MTTANKKHRNIRHTKILFDIPSNSYNTPAQMRSIVFGIGMDMMMAPHMCEPVCRR